MSRRGFTMVEVLVSCVLTVIVAGIGLRLLLRQHWAGIAQAETSGLQASLRAGLIFLTTEIRELGGTPGDPDILLFAPESLTYRAMRGTGIACSIGSDLVLLDAASLSGYRSPQAGRDSLLLHMDGQPQSSSDDRWLRLPILSVGPGTCGGNPAITLTTVLDTAVYPPGQFAPLAPVRTFEVMQIKLYQSGGDSWLGGRSISAGEGIQPIIGPLSNQGLVLAYFDSAGGPATLAERIRSVGLSLTGLSTNGIRTEGGYGTPQRRTDSLITTIVLRNW